MNYWTRLIAFSEIYQLVGIVLFTKSRFFFVKILNVSVRLEKGAFEAKHKRE
jgi:hypothetical protein